MLRFIFRKLKHGYIWQRVFVERFTEPLHLNVIAIFVALFGSLRMKIAFDLVLRHHHSYAILEQADFAKNLGIKTVTLIEFGVANGAGLLNICEIARRVTAVTGVEFRIYGFDTGKGMPPPESYRDHPELYSTGDFPMNHQALKQRLPANATLVLGELKETVEQFVAKLSAEEPVGFVSIDVDYHSSTRDALKIFSAAPDKYLPRVQIYLDDVEAPTHNSWCGELFAVHEFNAANELRKIEHHTFLRGQRIFKNARWIDHMMMLHVLDAPMRSSWRTTGGPPPIVLDNPYIS